MEMPRRMSQQARNSLSFIRSDWMRPFSQSESQRKLYENGLNIGDETSHCIDLENETK